MFVWKAMMTGLTTLGLLIGSAAAGLFPGEDVIVIKKGVDDVWEMIVNGEELTIDVDSLEVGDSQTVTLDDGTELVIKRTESGVSLNYDGEDIDLMDHKSFSFATAHGQGHANVVVAGGEKKVKVIAGAGGENVFFSTGDHDVSWVDINDGNKVVISGLDDIDDDAKARIEALLAELGIDKEVSFRKGPKFEFLHDIRVDVEEDDGHPRVIVIERKKEDQ